MFRSRFLSDVDFSRRQDQIIRAGGDTDPSLPWPINHSASRDSSMEKPSGSAGA